MLQPRVVLHALRHSRGEASKQTECASCHTDSRFHQAQKMAMCAAAACHLHPGFSRVLEVSATRQGSWEKGWWEKRCSYRPMTMGTGSRAQYSLPSGAHNSDALGRSLAACRCGVSLKALVLAHGDARFDHRSPVLHVWLVLRLQTRVGLSAPLCDVPAACLSPLCTQKFSSFISECSSC